MTTAINHKSDAVEQNTPDTPKKQRSISNLLVRFTTGMVVLPLIIILILWGGWPFTIVIGLLAILGTGEFYFMERAKGLQNNAIIGIAAAVAVLLAFHLKIAWLWQSAIIVSVILTFAIEFGRSREWHRSLFRVLTTVGGSLYIAFPFAFAIAIRQIEPFGIQWVFTVIYCTWGTDTFSYLIGSRFGKTKLAPTLSPNKTREGAIAGIIFGAFLPMLVLWRVGEMSWMVVPLLLICPFAAIAGDLFESAVKRFFGVKDSHIPGFNIFPGHGGALDRIDSILWVIPLFYFYLIIVGTITPLI